MPALCQHYASIMPDAPDIVLCSKLGRHIPTDSSKYNNKMWPLAQTHGVMMNV